MCGIAGIFDLSGAPVPPGQVQGMCGLMRHRGPDQDGFWQDGPVALGHARLSIIDLSPRGRNPIANEDQSVWLVANGEIYNHAELRRELIQAGHRFRSDTDTEVILHLYEQAGMEGIERLNGMFAFAIWDARYSALFLGRDRFGVKPLYYGRVGQRFVFASEAKAFLAVEGFSARPDPVSVAEHFTFQNTFGDRTLFAGMRMLPAGHWLQIAGDGREKRRRYWDLCLEPDGSLPAEDWAAGLRERFEAAVGRQLMSDVPLGSYLSGGMDTGSISAVASRSIPAMHTFTCGFDLQEGMSEREMFFDESAQSHGLANLLGTRHHELRLGPEALGSTLALAVWHMDEPRVGISYQVYRTAEMIAKHATVVLSGVGGDELFAGYPWRYEKILDCEPERFEQQYHRHWVRLLDDGAKQGFFAGDMRRQLGGWSSFESFQEVMAGNTGARDNLSRALYFDFKTFLHGLLMVDDKLSMAHSVEARVPFLDNDLVDYVRRIPADLKLRPGRSKIVLRKAMEGLLPPDILENRKQGFTPPDRTWYKGPNRAFVEDLILGDRQGQRGYFEPAAVRGIWEEHLADKADHRFLIWSVMCFEWWNRLFVDREEIPQAALSLRARSLRSVQAPRSNLVRPTRLLRPLGASQ